MKRASTTRDVLLVSVRHCRHHQAPQNAFLHCGLRAVHHATVVVENGENEVTFCACKISVIVARSFKFHRRLLARPRRPHILSSSVTLSISLSLSRLAGSRTSRSKEPSNVVGSGHARTLGVRLPLFQPPQPHSTPKKLGDTRQGRILFYCLPASAATATSSSAPAKAAFSIANERNSRRR